MADPKYANLYGIAHDQPDVYETSDLPEADQSDDFFEEICESVERLHISAPEAFFKFQGKEVDAAIVDFSDNIGKTRKNGYNVRSNDWELSSSKDDESPIQKYNRLKLEAEHLVEEVANLSKNSQKDLSKVSDTLAISINEANQLLSKIQELKLQDKIGLDFTNISNGEGVQFITLLNHLDKLGEESRNDHKVNEIPETIPDAKNVVQYVLSLNPSQKLFLTSRITDLEQKINKLEILIGSNTKQAVRLCNINTDDGLLNCCQWMIAKLSLLDSSQLEAIETRVNSINSRIEQFLTSQQSVTQESEKEKKIHELYEISNKVKEKSELIPNIIQRMTALQTLHSQGYQKQNINLSNETNGFVGIRRKSKQFVQTVAHLENLQSTLASNLASNDVVLNNLKDSLKTNVETIKENVQSLKNRVQELTANIK